MNATENGKPRRQLSDQLDRLDGIIDALADNLNEAVADAARVGTKSAVKEILLEVLTDPTVLDLVRTVTSPPGPASDSGLRPPFDGYTRLRGDRDERDGIDERGKGSRRPVDRGIAPRVSPCVETPFPFPAPTGPLRSASLQYSPLLCPEAL